MTLDDRLLRAERRSNIDLHRRLCRSQADGRQLWRAVIALVVAWALIIAVLVVLALML